MSNGVKYLLAGIAVVAMGFVTMGLLHPTVKCQTQTEISVPPDFVFNSITDTSLMKQWFNGLQSVKAEIPDKKYILKLIQKDKTMDLVLTYDTLKPNSSCVFSFDSEVYTSDYNLTLSGDSLRTTLHVQTVTRGKNIFLRSIFALSRPYFQQQQDSMFSRFKNVVENNYSVQRK